MELNRLQQEGVLIYNKSCRTLRLYDEILLRNQPTLPNTISSSYLHSFPLKLKVVIFTKPSIFCASCFFSLLCWGNEGSRTSNGMHVFCRNYIMSLIVVSLDWLLHWAKNPITDIFHTLGIRKVILHNWNTNLSPCIPSGCQDKVVVVTSYFVSPWVNFTNLGVFVLHNLQCVLSNGTNCILVLLAGVKNMSVWHQLAINYDRYFAAIRNYLIKIRSIPKIYKVINFSHIKVNTMLCRRFRDSKLAWECACLISQVDNSP